MIKKIPDPKTFLFGKISRKLTLVFLLVGIVAPTISISYFYALSTSFLSQQSTIIYHQTTVLRYTALLLIILIAIDTALIGFFVSRSISKPITFLQQATQKVERGDFSIQTNIKTGDELEQLSHAFNKTTLALSKMESERKEIDKAKSEFLSITSHELRTPMTPMKAQLQMLENGFFGSLTDKQKESIRIIMRNAERLDKIIEDFLEISRIEAARLKFVFRKVDLTQILHDTVSFLEGFAREKNITLKIHTTQLPIIEVDPDRVSQVLRNLVHNAIKFSPENSVVDIDAYEKDGYIQFSVADHGVGMKPADQIRVFEPFYQIEDHLNRKHGGTGLGLTICRGIVEAQKGKIWVESEVGKGSIFYFTVPLKPVTEIEPIKVLFSSKKEIENKVQEIFTEILGPMGTVEFSELKNKNALGRKDILDYIDTLHQQHILHDIQTTVFRQAVDSIFGTKTNPEKNDI
ncbi:MAG: HAMP domain-containing sensor histidine kinase [Candidatus Thermoplasmatota archaeon]